MKKIFITLITILSLLNAFSFQLTKQRDVLRDSNTSLYVKVKTEDLNRTYSYVWKEGNRTLGNTNPLKTSFSKGEHNGT